MSGALGLMMTSVAVSPIVQIGVSSVVTEDHGTDLAISKPGTTVAGDFMIALMARGNTDTWTMPTGWTAVVNGQICVAWKRAGIGEGSSFTFTTESSTLRGAIVVYRHCAFDAAGTVGTASGGSACVAPSVDLSDVGLLLAFFANTNDLTPFTTPTDMLSLVSSFDPDAPSIAVFNQQLSAGPSGTRTSTPSGGGSTAGILIALKGN